MEAETGTPFNVDSNQPMKKMEPRKHQRKTIIQKLFSGQELLTTLTIITTVIAIIIGATLRAIYVDKKWSQREKMYIQFLGEIFLRMLKMLIVPLLMCSIIAAIGSLDLSLSKKMGLQSIFYYVATTTVAVFQGILWVLLIRPGKYSGSSDNSTEAAGPDLERRNVTTVDTLLDLARNLFPPNIVEACFSQDRTSLVFNATDPKMNLTDLLTWKMVPDTARGTNVLGLVVFSIAIGIACAQLGKKAKAFIDVVEALSEAVMMITKGVIWFSPFGVFFLVIGSILEMKSFEVLIGQMGLYFITVLWGLFVHGFITVPGMYLLFLRKFPFKFIKNMGPAIITAFGTGSSSASLPMSMHCLEGANKIDVRVSRFVLPIGATINMDGTALYEAVAAIFISQVRNIELSIGQILAVSFTATMASIGAAGIPQAGLVTMVMVLDTVGLPADDIALILAVDWLLDRFRTVVNVLGDSIGAGIIAKYSRDELQRIDEIAAKNDAYNYPASAPNAQAENWNMTPM